MPDPKDYTDLINEFGSSGKDTGIATPYHDLINEFGSGSIEAKPVEQTPSNIPQPMTSEQIAESQRKFNESTPFKFSELPVVRQGIEGFKQGSGLVTSGLEDISQSRSATGVGKVGLGSLEMLGNVTGILPTIETGKEQLNKLGSDIGTRAEAVLTSGLPIGKTGSIVKAAMPSNRALNTIVETIGSDNLKSVLDQLKSNPRLSLMDVDPNVQIIAQGLAAKPGEPRNILDQIVKGRTATQKGAVTEAYTEAMGAPPNVLAKVEDLKNKIKATGKEINPIVAKTNPVDITPVVTNLDAKLKPGVTSVISAGEPLPLGDIEKQLGNLRKYLTDDKSFRTDPQSLHLFQSALRAKAEDLLSSSSGQDRQLGKSLMNVRNDIVNAIDKSSPQIQDASGNMIGSYRPALAKYRDVNDVNDAFKKGQLITRNRLGNLEDDPSYWDKWVKTATPQELEAAREGARLAVSHQMGSITNAARKGMNIPEIEFNAEKLKLLFGDKEVQNMMKKLSDEKSIADTNTKLFQNSQTAMRLLGAKATEVRPDYKPNLTAFIAPAAELAMNVGAGIPVLGSAGVLGYQGLRKGITKIGQRLDQKTNKEIATLASSTGELKDQLIKYLESQIPQPKQSLLRKAQSFALPVLPP